MRTKTAKHHIISGWVLSIVAVILTILSGYLSYKNNESYASLYSIGGALLGTGIVNIVRYTIISNDPEKNEKFERSENDERTIFVRERSANLSLSAIIFLDLILLIVCSFIKSLEFLTSPISILVFVHISIYIIVYMYIKKKY